MEQLIACGAVIFLQLILYLIIGSDLCRWAGLKDKGLLILIVGFFGYFGLFQLAALPLIFFKAPFHVLVILWGIVSVLILLKGIIWNRKELWQRFCMMKQELSVRQWYLALVALILLLLLIVYQCIHYYMGFDTAFYVGTINTTLYTDRMYLYDGETGLIEKYLDMRYALSGFYMNTAFWCKVLGVAPIIAQNYGMGSICALMAVLLMFLIGKQIFHDDSRKSYLYTCIIIGLNCLFVSGYSTADFLLYRNSESKGFCANVVIVAVFYAIAALWENVERKENWRLLFFIAAASVPVSMSAIFIVPAMIGIAALTECLIWKKIRYLWYGILCVLPNVVYLLLYFLYTRKIWLIMVE